MTVLAVLGADATSEPATCEKQIKESHSPPVMCTTPAPAKSVAPHPNSSARDASLHNWYASGVAASSHL